MDDIQQKQKNALDMARKKNEERLQSSRDHQQSMKDAKLQNQKKLQLSSNYQQHMKAAELQNQNRLQPTSFSNSANTVQNHRDALAEARRKDRERQQAGERKNVERSESEIAKYSAAKAGKIMTEVESGHEIKAAADAAKLAFTLRKAAGDGSKTAWIVTLVIGIIADICSLTWILGAIITLILLIVLWGKGRWKIKVLQLFDLIPFVSLLPLTTISVLWCWHEDNKKRKKKIEKAEKIEKSARIGDRR